MTPKEKAQELVDKITTVDTRSKEIVDYHFSMGEEISEIELNDTLNKNYDHKRTNRSLK